MGNIPPKEKVIFITNFINFIESSEKYEFELFRNLPIFNNKDLVQKNTDLKGKINIITKNRILNIEKKILMNDLIITNEKYLDKESITNYPIVYCQKSTLEPNEKNYCIRYKQKSKKFEDNLENNPGLFIFLVDQNGSMSGTPIKIASQSLQLFLQSLPAGSYYQIIGFGSKFKMYDIEPKEYTKENIPETFKKIGDLKADLGGTNIYSPLKYIYDSYKKHEEINLSRYIFLLTDGEINNKKKFQKLQNKIIQNIKYFLQELEIFLIKI